MTHVQYEERDLGGWGWVARLPEGGYYATNQRHQGLFLVLRGDVLQIEGTMQFQPSSFDEFKRRVQSMRRETRKE